MAETVTIAAFNPSLTRLIKLYKLCHHLLRGELGKKPLTAFLSHRRKFFMMFRRIVNFSR